MWKSPWAFDRNLVVLRSIPQGEVPESVDLDVCEFNVQVSGLPYPCIHAKMVEFIGNTIATFVHFDAELHNGNNGSVMCVRIHINITKPLLRVLNIEGPNNRMFQHTLGYERLPNFCYYCGLMGHLVIDCSSCMELIGDNGRIDESRLVW